MIFWLGFLAILIIGSLWAGLSKDPFGPDFFEEEFGAGAAGRLLAARSAAAVMVPGT